MSVVIDRGKPVHHGHISQELRQTDCTFTGSVNVLYILLKQLYMTYVEIAPTKGL